MKKIYLVFIIAVITEVLFAIYPFWFRFMWSYQIWLIPLTAGILMVLAQNEDKSYNYLPKLLIGSVLINFVYAFVIFVVNHFKYLEYNNTPFWEKLNIIDIFMFALPLVLLCLFGGLIGLVIRGSSLLIKRNPESKIILALKKILGGMILALSAIVILASSIIFLVLFFNPSSSLLNIVMVDFRLIDVVGVAPYYLLLLLALSIILIPLTFVVILGLMLFFSKKKFFNKKLFSCLTIYFFIALAIFLLLLSLTDSKFEVKKAEMKGTQSVKYFDIKDFDEIYISRYVEFDDIIIKQGEQFSIVTKGSEYDHIGLDFEKINSRTLAIKRSKLETCFNTDTWTVENRDILFRARSKHLTIEITMPDVEKIENEGANIELENLKVDKIEIKLNNRFNSIKGNIKVDNTLKLDAEGGIINLSGSARGLIINSGDCWIEMDKFIAEKATIDAINTSRLNVYVTGNMEVLSGKNSGIVNHYDEL